MTTEELMDMFQRSRDRTYELQAIAEMGFEITRAQRLEFSRCVRRLRAVAFELWLAQGKPVGPEFAIFQMGYNPKGGH
jgi:hypothetical protein